MNYCDKCGNCSRCGECCAATLPITKNEEKNIREYIKEHNIKPEFFQKHDDMNLQCCFYDRIKKVCKIYEVRPSICRSYKCDKSKLILDCEKDIAHKKAYWNSLKNGKITNLTDMRLLFYNDPRSLIGFLMYGLTNGTMKATEKEFNQLKMVLKSGGQVELANCLEGKFKNE